jgi:hypothetical protein
VKRSVGSSAGTSEELDDGVAVPLEVLEEAAADLT